MTRFKGFLAILFLSISPLVMALDLDAAKARNLRLRAGSIARQATMDPADGVEL